MIVGSVHNLPCFKDLIAVLFECFSIMSFGYLSCRFKLISPQAKDLGAYLTTFALPMIIFLNIAQMEFQTINLSFLFCMLIAKLSLFISVTLLTLAISYPTNSGYAGSLAILATQSNDFALGYPLIKSLYGETRPEMLNYLSLMAPLQLLILNPLGIILLEFHKSRNEKPRKLEIESTGDRATSPQINGNGNGLCKLCEVKQSSQQIEKRPVTEYCDSELCPEDNCDIAIARHQRNTTYRRNTKSLTLVMPAREESYCASQVSIGSLGGKLDGDHDNAAQTRPKYKSLPFAPKSFTNHSQAPDADMATKPVRQASELAHHKQQTVISTISNERQHPTSEQQQTNADCCGCQRQRPLPSPIIASDTDAPANPMVSLNFLKALATNPLIIASVVALLVNLTHGPELPKLVTKVSNTIAASFAAPALFVVGLSMFGKFELILRNPNDLLLSSVLVLTKVLILPNLMRSLALMILPRYVDAADLPFLVDFSYLYGLLPTAPTACIIANQYGVLSNVVSISMLLSTFASAPLMLAASAIITQAPDTLQTIADVVTQCVQVSSLITLTLASVSLFAFWRSGGGARYMNLVAAPEAICRRIHKMENPAHIFLPLLALTQVVIGIGGIIWYFIDPAKLEALVPQETIKTSGSLFEAAHNLTGDGLTTDRPVALDPDVAIGDRLEPIMVPVFVDLGLWTICTVHYIFSTSGMLMSRFVILSIIVTLAARTFRDQVVAAKVSHFMMTMYAVLGTSVVVWLIFDSSQLKCTPAEPSLPRHLSSLSVRLAFNFIFLFVSVPLFAMIFKADNEKRQMQKLTSQTGNHNDPNETDVNPLSRRRFLTSHASLTSDTSSATTTNTNIETGLANCSPGGNQIEIPNARANHPNNLLISDSVSIVLDCRNFEILKNSHIVIEGQVIDPQSNVFGPYGATELPENPTSMPNDTSTNNSSETDHKLNDPSPCDEKDEPIVIDSIPPNSSRSAPRVRLTEFNRYSILIVFMLIDSILNLTSILQILNQDSAYGTFRQVEITNVALDFGQGLLTFLIYGIRGIFERV